MTGFMKDYLEENGVACDFVRKSTHRDVGTAGEEQQTAFGVECACSRTHPHLLSLQVVIKGH